MDLYKDLLTIKTNLKYIFHISYQENYIVKDVKENISFCSETKKKILHIFVIYEKSKNVISQIRVTVKKIMGNNLGKILWHFPGLFSDLILIYLN